MPDWKRRLRDHLSLPAMAGSRDERALQEMADHLGDLYDDALRRGLPPDDAEAHVLEWLGDPTQARAELTAAEPRHARASAGRWVERREESLQRRGGLGTRAADVLRDVRHAARGLGRRPLFTGVVIAVLALGIGAATAIFSVIHGVLIAPLPFDEADRLVSIDHAAPSLGIDAAGQCAAWHFTYEEEARLFDGLGMASMGSGSVTGTGDPEAVPVLHVTHGLLSALRLTPLAGRRFNPGDDEPGAAAVVMLGHGYWQRRFAGDPGVVGATLSIDGETREIIGVAPPELASLGWATDLLVPLRFERSRLFVGNIGYAGIARLAPGVSREEAARELNRLLPTAWEKFPGGPLAGSSAPTDFSALLTPLHDDVVGSVANLLWVVMAGVSVLLIIAGANVAGLYLVRAESREGEIALRVALGASGRRTGWEYLKESLILGMLGGLGGILVARVVLGTLLTMAPDALPRMGEVRLQGAELLFAFCISLGVGIVFGLIPALRPGHADPGRVLREGGRDGMRSRRTTRAQNALAAGQMAMAVVLLIVSGLTVRTVWRLQSVEPGFQSPEQVLTVRLSIPEREVPDAARMASTYEAIVRHLEEVPGVRSVGLATANPMDGSTNVNRFFTRAGIGQEDVMRRHKWIGGGYLETLGIPLVAGRSLNWDDVRERAPVALLSETLARQVFGSPEAAMGRYLAARPDPPLWKEVVGVVADVHEDGLDQPPPPLVYWPQVTLGFWEGSEADQVQTWRDAGIAVRSERVGTPGFLDDIQNAIWDVSPSLPLRQVRSLGELASDSIARASFTMTLLGVAGAAALVLGLVGVYGVIAYTVSRRTRELGMRMALGSGRRRLLVMVVRQGLVLAATGTGLGLVAAALVVHTLPPALAGVDPLDPFTFTTVAVGMLVVAGLASYLPARRAARVDPMLALRAE